MGLDKLSHNKDVVNKFTKKHIKDTPSSMSREDEIKKYALPKVLAPTILGMNEDGTIDHNFPCPVCKSKIAIYTNIQGKFVFAPCEGCKKEGYSIIKKRKWFWQ